MQRLIDSYKLWHIYLPKIEKISRFTIGQKIDSLFLEFIELILRAEYANKNQKTTIIQTASARLDCLKLFLQISWELKIFDEKKYIQLSTPLSITGKMLGGWLKKLQKETPQNRGG